MDIAKYFVFDQFSAAAFGMGAAYLALALLLLWVGKKVYDAAASFSLDEQLTRADNKAVAVSFAGYLIALGLVIHGVLQGDSGLGFARDMGETVIWSVIGMGLLVLAQIVNDRLLFADFSNRKELVEDNNVGLGAAEAGAYIGAALIIRGCLSGEETPFWPGLFGTLLFFVFGQMAFLAFAVYYQKLTSFDFKGAIEADNPAAGVSFGLALVAFGNLLSGPLYLSDSLATFIIWGALGALILGAARWLLDRVVLPGRRLDEEIQNDKNWGASILIGGLFVLLSMLVNSAIL